MERVDLDGLEHRAESADPAELFTWVIAIAPELRTTREVVEAARKAAHAVDLVGTTDYSARVLFDLGQAVAAYDRAVGRPAAADQPPGDG